MEKTYQEGMNDAIKLWGTVCGRQGSCEDCLLSQIAGIGGTCQDVAKQFPAKTVSLLSEMAGKPLTYAQEYATRFPASGMNAEMLYESGVCRKTIFEGNVECSGGDCVACWNQIYEGDRSADEDN